MAAGSGARMGMGVNKVLMDLGGASPLERCARTFAPEVDGMLAVARPEDLEAIDALGLAIRAVPGGRTRQQSVLEGLRALPEGVEVVLVHDAARPFVDVETIRRCIASVRAHGSGVASVPVKDTIKRTSLDGAVLDTPPRETLYAAQTPQAFRPAQLRAAIEALQARGETATDDAGAMELAGHTVRLVEGSYANIKLTTPEDIAMAEHLIGARQEIRVGHGYDVHRLVEGRKLILCGVEVPYEKGLLGHSDADVALHALMDALLGSAAMGDIGTHFPDTDAAYKGISSLTLLARVRELLGAQGFRPQSVDITIVAQQPKLRPYIKEMVARVAHGLGIAEDHVNVKATTTEGLGFEGEGLGISAHAVAVLQRST